MAARGVLCGAGAVSAKRWVVALPTVVYILYIMYKLPSITATLIRERLAEVINKVSVRGDRVLIERHGKPVAALISLEDLELLEKLEDKYDVEEARRILAKTNSADWVPWEQVRRELKL